MLELAMAAPRGHKVPAIRLQQAENFANFHAGSISGASAKAETAAALRTVMPNLI